MDSSPMEGESFTGEAAVKTRQFEETNADGGGATTVSSTVGSEGVVDPQVDGNDTTERESVQERETMEFICYTETLCHCGKRTVLKVAGPRSQNRGLRYLSCEAFVFFAKKRKRNHCNFFQWIDPPRVTREEIRQIKKEARANKRQNLEIRAQTREQQMVIKTRAAVRHELEQMEDSEKVVSAGSRAPDFVNPNGWSDSPEVEIQGKKETEHETGSAVDEDRTGKIGRHSYSLAIPPLLAEVCDAPAVDQNFGLLVEGNAHYPQREPEKRSELTRDRTSTDLGVDHDAAEQGGALLALTKAPLCFCSQPAVMKIAKSKGPNKGLRYWTCQNARPLFAKRKPNDMRGCKFFMWIDPPRATREQIRAAKKDARAKKHQKRALSSRIKDGRCSSSPRQHLPDSTDTEMPNRAGGAVDTTEQGAIVLAQNYNIELVNAEVQRKEEEILQIGTLDEDQTVKAEVSVYSKIWNALPPAVVEGCEVMWRVIESSPMYEDCAVLIKGSPQDLQMESEVPNTLGEEKLGENGIFIKGTTQNLQLESDFRAASTGEKIT